MTILTATGDFTTTTTDSSNSTWYQTAGIVAEKEKDAGDTLKDIAAFIGLKVINVMIKDDKIVLTCIRNRKKYEITIKNSEVTIVNAKGKIIRQFDLYPNIPTTTVGSNIQPYWYSTNPYVKWSTTDGNSLDSTKFIDIEKNV